MEFVRRHARPIAVCRVLWIGLGMPSPVSSSDDEAAPLPRAGTSHSRPVSYDDDDVHAPSLSHLFLEEHRLLRPAHEVTSHPARVSLVTFSPFAMGYAYGPRCAQEP